MLQPQPGALNSNGKPSTNGDEAVPKKGFTAAYDAWQAHVESCCSRPHFEIAAGNRSAYVLPYTFSKLAGIQQQLSIIWPGRMPANTQLLLGRSRDPSCSSHLCYAEPHDPASLGARLCIDLCRSSRQWNAAPTAWAFCGCPIDAALLLVRFSGDAGWHCLRRSRICGDRCRYDAARLSSAMKICSTGLDLVLGCS